MLSYQTEKVFGIISDFLTKKFTTKQWKLKDWWRKLNVVSVRWSFYIIVEAMMFSRSFFGKKDINNQPLKKRTDITDEYY